MFRYTTRFVSENEAETLTQIHAECFPRYWSQDAFTDFFSVNNTFAVLVEEEGDSKTPLAMMVYRTAFEQADIITIAVRPAYRKKGIARKLLDSALAHSAAQGVKKMFLEVEDGNEAAIKLYENAGFKHISRRKLYYKQLDGSLNDALVMSKKLIKIPHGCK